jgi:hypothetical protein
MKSIVVLGAGPAGALAALSAAEKNYPVVLITKYPYPTRGQRVKLDSDAVKTLKAFCDPHHPLDKELFAELQHTGNTVAIETIEEFLWRKIKNKVDEGKIRFFDETTALLTNIHHGLFEDPTITITHKTGEEPHEETIDMLHLIDASGSSARTAFQMTADVSVETLQHSRTLRTAYEKDYDELAHPAQGTTIFHLRREAIEPDSEVHRKLSRKWWEKIHPQTIFVPKFSSAALSYLQKTFAWDEDYPPTTYIISDAKREQFYVGGEIPSGILKIKDPLVRREAVIQWNQYILQHHFGLTKDMLSMQENGSQEALSLSYEAKGLSPALAARVARSKINMDATAFDMKLSKLEDPVRNLSHTVGQHVMLALGDAFQSPHFHRAHGCNDALKSAKKFADCLPRNTGTSMPLFGFAKFKSYSDKIRSAHDDRLRKIAVDYAQKGDETSRIHQLKHEIQQFEEKDGLTKIQEHRLMRLKEKCAVLQEKLIDKIVKLPCYVSQAHIDKLLAQVNTLEALHGQASRVFVALPPSKVSVFSLFRTQKKDDRLSHYLRLGEILITEQRSLNAKDASLSAGFEPARQVCLRKIGILQAQIDKEKPAFGSKLAEMQSALEISKEHLRMIEPDLTSVTTSAYRDKLRKMSDDGSPESKESRLGH